MSKSMPRWRARTRSPRSKRDNIPLVFALFSGLLLGCAFPPVGWDWLVWVGLVPLLLVVHRADHPRRAFWLGWLAGCTFFLIVLHPLVSVESWVGWVQETRTAMHGRLSRQWWFMHGIWLAFSVWCALIWGLWAALLRQWGRGRWTRVITAVALWIVLPEWLRARTTFGFEWAFLGNACAHWPAVCQVAALGGVALLSGLVVLVNVGLAAFVSSRRAERGWWVVPVFALECLAIIWLWGSTMLDAAVSSARPISVALLQYHQPSVAREEDYSSLGLIRGYEPLARNAIQHGAQIIVLSESAMRGVVSLDGSPSPSRPPNRTYTLASWNSLVQSLLQGSDAVAIIGINAAANAHDYNSMGAWTARGPIGWYHKRRLVPFAEYRPSGWGTWVIRSDSLDVPGQGSQLWQFPGMTVGTFICQEVLFGNLMRESVLDGAELLVSGGNDGVFANPAVAKVHEDAAQLRAVETGRYIVRAMKTGISAVIDPTGREVVRSQMNAPALLFARASPRSVITPYVWFGDWMVCLSALLAFLIAGFQRRRRG